MYESRHSDGGAFYRVSFDGWATGDGTSNSSSHSYSDSDYYNEWSSSGCDYGCGYGCDSSCGYTDDYSENGYDSNSNASYNYATNWNWNIDGTKSYSLSNDVTGHYDDSCYYNYNYTSYSSDSSCGCDCSYGYGCHYSSDDDDYYCCSPSPDYSDAVDYTGWSIKGGQASLPSTFNVRWTPFNGGIHDENSCGYGCGYGYSCGCGCGCENYSYNGASFSAPNFSVTMYDESYDGEEYESNEVWHKGRSVYGSGGYSYSGTAPTSHIQNTSVTPTAPSTLGNTSMPDAPVVYSGNPNFNNFAYVDVEAIIDEKYPLMAIPSVPAEPALPEPEPETETPIMENACFVAGTLVLLEDSSMKRIEDIVVGDSVLAKNDKLPDAQVESRRVNEIKHNPPSVTYHLVFRAKSNGREICLRVTPEHPFYVPRLGWVSVENLEIGDDCVSPIGNKIELISKRFDPEMIPVFNLEIDKDHTYFVGDDAENCLLVHNEYLGYVLDSIKSGVTITWEGTKGVAQGVSNIANGLLDVGAGILNTPAMTMNGIAYLEEKAGILDSDQPIRFSYIPSPDWSRGLITEEYGEEGTWSDTHGWSKAIGADGAITLVTLGANKAVTAINNAVDVGKDLKNLDKVGDIVSNTQKYGPHMKGPLAPSKANTFRGGVYTEKVLSEDLVVYRVYGGTVNKEGSFFTTIKPSGPLQVQIDLALNPEWGNAATKVTTVKIPKGTKIYEGFAEQQQIPAGGVLRGGGTQIYVPDINPLWFID